MGAKRDLLLLVLRHKRMDTNGGRNLGLVTMRNLLFLLSFVASLAFAAPSDYHGLIDGISGAPVTVDDGSDVAVDLEEETHASEHLSGGADAITDLADLNESTIEAAIDTLLNLASVQGETLSFSDVGADAFWGFDDTDNEYAPLTAAEAFAIIAGVSGTVTGDWEFDGDFNVGDPGTESGSMQLNGFATNVIAQINNFGATYDAELWLHRHSSTEGPDILFTRSDSDTSSHGNVSDGQTLGTFTWGGWYANSYYAGASLIAVVDGVPGVGDMPTQFKFFVSPDGSATPVIALALRADKTAEFYGSIYGDTLTASQLLATDGSKNLQSLAVATYPSLTELSYVKGATSAIQTQIANILDGTTAFTDFNGAVIDSSNMADADHGDVSWSSGVATVEIVSGANAVDSDAYVDNSIDDEHLNITTGINIVFDGGGSAIQDAEMICEEIPFAATITEARLVADQSGSIVVDWWLDSYANYPPTNADSICDAGTCPTLSTAQKYSDATLTSWTTSISAEDVICAYVDGAATSITRATAVLKLIR